MEIRSLEVGRKEQAHVGSRLGGVSSDCSELEDLESTWVGQPGWGSSEVDEKTKRQLHPLRSQASRWGAILHSLGLLMPHLSLVPTSSQTALSIPTPSKRGPSSPPSWAIARVYSPASLPPCLFSLQSIPHTTVKYDLSKIQA